jgi:Nucleotide-diphospho-sugar transferase
MQPNATRAIATLGIGSHERLLRIAARSIRPYADRHGYDLHLHTHSADPTRPPHWTKIRILLDLLERYETVVWLDSDLVIVDARRDIAAELEPDYFLYLVEHAYNDERIPNTGVMLLRSGPTATRFLEEAWALDEHLDHEWAEQGAIMELLGYDLQRKRPGAATAYRAQTKLISPRWNSVFFAPARRPRIRHFAAWPPRTRTIAMLAATAEAELRRRLGY